MVPRSLLLTVLLITTAAAVFTAPSYAAGTPAGSKPNIVLIMCDDAGFADFGFNGGFAQTPVLDKLASEGIRFTRAFSNGRCWPTRASLMSGLNPQLSGDSPIGPNAVTLPEMLKQAGYATYMVGKWHLGHGEQNRNVEPLPTPVGRGFQRFYGIWEGAAMPTKEKLIRQWEDAQKKPKGGFGPRIIEDERMLPWEEVPDDYYVTFTWGRKAVEMVKSTPDGQPFFLYLAHTAPHWPLEARPEFKARYKGKFDGDWEVLRQEILQRQKQMGLFPENYPLAPFHEMMVDASRRSQNVSGSEEYFASITEMDESIGWLIDAIREMGRDKNTLLIFISDNGGEPLIGGTHRALVSNTPFAGWKVSQWEGGLATPFLAWWPETIPANALNLQHEIHLEDFMATFLELAGLEYPKEYEGRPIFPLQGRSFLPALLDPAYNGGPRIWCWEHDSQRAVWAAPWKLNYTEGRHPIHNKSTPEEFHGWTLFKLDEHRIEMTDLAEAHPEELQRMIGLWQEWANSVGWRPSQRFPLLEGDTFKGPATAPTPATYDPAASPIGRTP